MTNFLKTAAIVSSLLLITAPLGGCGVVALAGVAYMMGKDTDTHVQTCAAPNDKGETVCHDTDKKGVVAR